MSKRRRKSESLTPEIKKDDTRSEDNKKIKIIISYHKKDAPLKDDVLTPVHAGRKIAVERQNKDLDWLLENAIGDDGGENISEKNLSYNELTSIYWAWKNYGKLGNPDYIGSMHYRRHFVFKGGDLPVYELDDEINENYLSEILGYSPEKVLNLAESHDLIVPKAQRRISLYEQFRRNHDIADLDTAISILKEKYPGLSDCADEYLNGQNAYFCNMFIMPKSLFFQYAEYLFNIIFEFEKRVDITNKRLFISEWLTGIFIQNQIKLNKNIYFLPIALAEAAHDIPVVFAADDNYALYLGVALTSLFKNARKSTRYQTRILIPGKFSERNQNKILSLLEQYPNHSIIFHEINDEAFDDVEIKIKHISKTTFYRLLIAELFQDWDKCVYLDADLTVLNDLTVFYRYALDNNILAGVKAPGYFYPEISRLEHLEETNLPSVEQYINAGVLLMDLKKIRDEDFTRKFVELSRKNFSSQDQDVLNIACYGRIKHLPFKFNAMTKYTEPKSDERYKAMNIFPKDWIDEADKKPVIIHYANKEKPWQNIDLHQAYIWLEYAHISPFADILKDICRAEKQYLALKVRENIRFIRKQMRIGENYVRSIPDNTRQQKNIHYKISVIMPVFNSETTLEETLESAIVQTATLGENAIEIICVDDGSADTSLDILCEYAEHFKFIKVYTQPNSGSGSARNKAISVAQGEYVVFLDSDDWYPSETTLENLYMSVTKNNADICGGSFCSAQEINGKIMSNYKFPLDGYTFKKRGFIDYADYQFDFGYHRFIYKLKFLRENKISFPDYLRYQDPPFFAKAMISAGKFYAVPEMTYKYRVAHKEINWTAKKIVDLVSALTEMFEISRKARFSKLHGYTYLRYKDHIKHILPFLKDNNILIFSLIENMLKTLDVNLLGQASMPIDESELASANKMLINLIADISATETPSLKKLEERVSLLDLKIKLMEKDEHIKEINQKHQLDLANEIMWRDQMIKDLNSAVYTLEHSWTWRIGRIFVSIPGFIKRKVFRRN